MHMHAYRHALMKKCTYRDRVYAHAVEHRSTHPSHMLTSLLSQNGKTPLDLAQADYNDEVEAAFAENMIITDDNKNTVLLICAKFGLASRLRAVLKAGANAAHTNKVCVRV